MKTYEISKKLLEEFVDAIQAGIEPTGDQKSAAALFIELDLDRRGRVGRSRDKKPTEAALRLRKHRAEKEKMIIFNVPNKKERKKK